MDRAQRLLVLVAPLLSACAWFDGIAGDYAVASSGPGAGGSHEGGAGGGANWGGSGPVEHPWAVAIDASDAIVFDVVGLEDGAVAVGAFEGVLATGGVSAGPSVGRDGFVVRLGPAGGVRWLQTFGGPFADEARALVVADDQVIVAGRCREAELLAGETIGTAGSGDACLVWLDLASGMILRAKSFGGAADDVVMDLAMAGGVLHLAGDTEIAYGLEWQGCTFSPAEGAAGEGDLFVARADDASCEARGFASAGGDGARGVAADGSVLHLAGHYGGGFDLGDGPLPIAGVRGGVAARFGAQELVESALPLWGEDFNACNGVALTTTGLEVVAGVVSAGAGLVDPLTGGARRGFVGVVAGDGVAWQWAQVFGNSDGVDDVAAWAVAAADGRIAVTGDFSGSGQAFLPGATLDAVGPRDGFVALLEDDGTPLGATSFGAVESGGAASGQAVALTGEPGNVIVGGWFERSVVIDGIELTGAGSRSAFVAWLGPTLGSR